MIQKYYLLKIIMSFFFEKNYKNYQQKLKKEKLKLELYQAYQTHIIKIYYFLLKMEFPKF